MGGEHIKDSLASTVCFIRQHPELRLEVAVHTDSRGSASGNLQLSRFRAGMVRDYLIDVCQLDPATISCRGYGEDWPLVAETTAGQLSTNAEKNNRYSKNSAPSCV